jgi:ABC-2 type transport system ATP-binding protein
VTCLAVVDLRKRYGGTTLALDGVTRSFGIGITGLLGPNGAGKSTLIRCIAGVENWDDGSVEVTLGAGGRRLRRAVGYMPEVVAFPRELRVRSYLRLVCSAKGVRKAWRGEIEEKLLLTGLAPVADRVIGNLSKGYRQRLGLAQAMIGNPPVLLLDEPVSSLDPINVVDVRRSIRFYARSACVVVSTHQLAEATALSDRVVVLDRGRVAYDGPMSDLGRGRQLTFELEVLARDGDALRVVVDSWNAAGHVRTIRAGEAYAVTVPGVTEVELARRVALLVSEGCGVIGVRPVGDALEEAFAHAVGNA